MYSDRGTVVVSCIICLVVFCVFTALVLDVGFGIYNKRQIQIAADATSLAGAAELLKPNSTVSSILTAAKNVGTLNKLASTEVTNPDSVILGNWNFDQKKFNAWAAPYNAVKVFISRQTPVYFGKVININKLAVTAQSIAVVGGAQSANCLIPFGVTSNFLTGTTYNQTLTASSQAAGNWGKVQIGNTNINSSPSFISAMVSGVCSPPVTVGDIIPTSTGFAGVDTGFKDRIVKNPYVVMPVVDMFPNGNSNKLTIQGFIYVQLLSVNSQGNNWTVKFKLLKGLISGHLGGSTAAPYAKTRILVL